MTRRGQPELEGEANIDFPLTAQEQGDLRWYYAQTALRDFQSYEGRAADLEARAQRLTDRIGQALDELAEQRGMARRQGLAQSWNLRVSHRAAGGCPPPAD